MYYFLKVFFDFNGVSQPFPKFLLYTLSGSGDLRFFNGFKMMILVIYSFFSINCQPKEIEFCSRVQFDLIGFCVRAAGVPNY